MPLSAQIIEKSEAKQTKKEGFTLGVLPVVAFDADLGLQLGALTNLYWYGDNYPRYRHSLYMEVSRFNAGTTLLRTYYDSPELIKSFRTTVDITWFNDLTMDFYGFNGRQSLFNKDFEDEDNTQYISRVFYKHKREMFRAMINLKKQFNEGSKWQWITGVTLFNMDISSVDIEHLNKKNNKPLPEVDLLYDKYKEWGLISDNEANGGLNTYIKAGIGYDSRNKESFATKGVWTELLVALAPKILSSNSTEYGKITLYHRQYINLMNEKLVFAYRIGAQHKLWGNTPFYLLPHWNSTVMTSATSQGLGGGKTMRGIRRNRIVGEGSILANAEIRYIFHSFNIGRNTVSLGCNLFGDAGMVTQKYKVDLTEVPVNERSLYFRNNDERPHYSAGLGFKAALNENFILSVEHGRAMDKNDGESGFYVTMNYLF